MEKAVRTQKGSPRKPPPSSIRLMPQSLGSLFVAASVGRLSHLFPRWMSLRVEARHDVTSSQLMVVFLLSQTKQTTLGQLAQMLDLTPRAITGLMKGLEGKKLVNRVKDKEDQRVTWVELSSTGRTFFKKVRPEASVELGSLFGVLSKREQAELVRIIEKLTDYMKTQMDERS